MGATVAGISIKIGGSRLFPQRVVTLLLAGIHFSEIPERLRDTNKYSADQPTGRRQAPEVNRVTEEPGGGGGSCHATPLLLAAKATALSTRTLTELR